MIKINRNGIALFLIALLMVLSACQKTKVECTKSSECLQKTCNVPKCDANKCVYSLQKNCCGNGLQDETENGKPGNKCTCPQDYGKCDGKGRVKAQGRLQNTTYLYYHCSKEDKCIFGINEKDIEIQNFPDTISAGFFKAGMLVTFNKPFDIDKDSLKIKISLDDLGKDILPPIELTKLKLFYSSELSRTEQQIAEKELQSKLISIGDEVLIEAPMNLGFRPREVEETGTFRYSIDYRYAKHVASGRSLDGLTIYTNETARNTFNSVAKPIFFVKSE